MKLSVEDARELIWGGDFSDEGLTVELQEQVGSRRWVSEHVIVVKDSDGRYWETGYEQGLTESQDTQPFEYEVEVVFVEVERVPVTTYEYRPVKS